MCHARKERVLMIGTDQRITSGPAARTAASRGRIHGCTRIVSRKVRFFSLAPRAPSIHGRYCCKSPKIPGDDFFERKEAKLSSPVNMAPRPSAKSPVRLSPKDEVAHVFIRESHQRPRKILISGGKRRRYMCRLNEISPMTYQWGIVQLEGGRLHLAGRWWDLY